MNRRDQGRSLLREWEAAKPANFYDDDRYLRMALARRLGPERLARAEPTLRQAGADSAGPVSRASFVLDRPEHLPRVEAWNTVGERVEETRQGTSSWLPGGAIDPQGSGRYRPSGPTAPCYVCPRKRVSAPIPHRMSRSA